MPEVFSSAETSLELVDPITGAVILAIPFLRDDSFSESPTYGPRGYHRSAAVSAARLRSKGTITIRKDAEGMAFAQEVERWQKGVIWYPMGSDLKGKRFRHPHIRKVMAQPDGTKEYRQAYDVRLADRTLSRPDAGLLSDSYTFDVQGGFDTPGSDRGEPIRAIDFHRTGSKTFIGLDGTFKTAGDGVAAFGLPWVVRRNLVNRSGDLHITAASGSGVWRVSGGISVLRNRTAAAPIPGWPVDVLFEATTLVATSSGQVHYQIFDGIVPGATYTISWYAKAGTGTPRYTVRDVTNATNIAAMVSYAASINPSSVTKLSVTITAPAGCTQIYFSPMNDSPTGTEVHVYGVHFEPGATATPYQPTNATGVDVAAIGGLVLEGAGTNLLLHSENFGNAAWAKAGVTSTTAADPRGGTTAGTLDLSVSGASIQQDIATAWGTNTFTGLLLLKGNAAGQRVSLRFERTNDGAIIGAERIIELTTSWEAYFVTAQGNGSGNVRFRLGRNTATGTVNFAFAQVEPGPLPTSYIPTTTTAATRQPDLVGIVPPHNLLKRSEEFGDSAWEKTGCSVASKTTAGPFVGTLADTVSGSGIPVRLQQSLGSVVSGKTIAFSVWIRVPSGPSTVLFLSLRNGKSGSQLSQSAAIGDSTWKQYTFSGTISSTVADLYIEIASSSASIVYEAWGALLNEGRMPGIYVPTTDTPIPAPVSPPLDPAYSQNGRMKVRLLAPMGPVATPSTPLLLGAQTVASALAADLRLIKGSAASHQIVFDRRHNGATGSGGTAGRAFLNPTPASFFDFTPHDIELEWTNEINDQTGVREMWQRIWIDGVLVASQDVAALYGATAWADIDPSRLISDGNVNAVISGPSSNPGGVIIEFAPRRAGYRQVERAA